MLFIFISIDNVYILKYYKYYLDHYKNREFYVFEMDYSAYGV